MRRRRARSRGLLRSSARNPAGIISGCALSIAITASIVSRSVDANSLGAGWVWPGAHFMRRHALESSQFGALWVSTVLAFIFTSRSLGQSVRFRSGRRSSISHGGEDAFEVDADGWFEGAVDAVV